MTAELLAGFRFRSVRGAQPASPQTRPSPALAIAAELGRPGRGLRFVGDTSIDMRPRRRRRDAPVGALWGFGRPTSSARSGASVLIASPLDLLDHLG